MKYYVKQKVFSLRDKFTIKDYSQNDVFQVQGKFMSLSNKLELLNMDGSQVLNSKKKLFRFLPLYYIYSNHDEELAEIKRKFSFKPKFDVKVGQQEYQVEGSIFAHTFSIKKDLISLLNSSSSLTDKPDKKLGSFISFKFTILTPLLFFKVY